MRYGSSRRGTWANGMVESKMEVLTTRGGAKTNENWAIITNEKLLRQEFPAEESCLLGRWLCSLRCVYINYAALNPLGLTTFVVSFLLSLSSTFLHAYMCSSAAVCQSSASLPHEYAWLSGSIRQRVQSRYISYDLSFFHRFLFS